MHKTGRQCLPFPQFPIPIPIQFATSRELSFRPSQGLFTDKGINLTDVLALIIVQEIAFRDPDCMATAESKMEALKQINHDSSTYYMKF
jgi:hypothetical protein